MLRNRSNRANRCIEISDFSRRTLLLGSLLAALPVRSALAADDAPWAAGFIRKVGNEIAAIIAAPATPDARNQRLASLIDRVVDVAGVARFCLGRYWRQASAQQQHDYIDLFHAVLMRAVLGHISTEQQQADPAIQVDVQRPQLREDSVYVPTVIRRGGTPRFTVTWVLDTDAADPRIVDVMAEGASLRVTIRADYAAFLQQHADNIDALLQALRAQACAHCTATGVVGQ